MSAPYKPVPTAAVLERAPRHDGASVQLFVGPGDGSTGYFGAHWAVTVSREVNGRTLVLSTRDYPWTEAGEAAARAEYAKQVAPPQSAFAKRVAVYALALSDDRTPNAMGLTATDAAGYLFDRLSAADHSLARRVLDGVGVSL